MACEKCGYEGEENENLCSICKQFAPIDEEKLKEYLDEKIDWRLLESFRKFLGERKTTKGMEKMAEEGKVMSRAAFGYKIIGGNLIIDEEKKLIVQKIFMEFLNESISLNQLSKRYGFSVNGLKKILRNFTYIGKVKFSGIISQGKHEAIISPELFNKVQRKLEEFGIR